MKEDLKIDFAETQYYRLAEGTTFERFVPPLKTDTNIGAQYDVVFVLLLGLHQQIERQTAGAVHKNPLATVIQAIWLTWSYAAHDVAALRKRLDELERQLASLLATPEEIASRDTVVDRPIIKPEENDEHDPSRDPQDP